MLQIYALSVVINVVMGIVVLFGGARGEEDVESASFLQSSAFTLALTILAGVIAASLLMAPYGTYGAGHGIGALPVFGDLLPACATVCGGCVFLARYIKVHYSGIYAGSNFFSLVEKNEFYIAIACLAVAAIHFFFPAVLFL